MSTVQVQLQLSFEQLLAAINQLPPAQRLELKQYLDNPRKKKSLSPRNGTRKRTNGASETTEADLIARIKLNSRLPEARQRRFYQLRRKLQDETIGESELPELQGLTSRLEWMNVERLEALIELAKLRKTDLDTLMKDLGLNRKNRVF